MSKGLATFIAERRLKLGYSPEELAAQIDADANYIVQIEMGRIGLPKRKRLERLASALQVQPDDLRIAAGKLKPPLPALLEAEIHREVQRIVALTNRDEQDRAIEQLPATLQQSLRDAIKAVRSEIVHRGSPPRTEE